jgi:hypothetical protein
LSAWNRTEQTVTTVRYVVDAREPWGATWNEVSNALDAAIGEYRRLKGDGLLPSDDSIRVHAKDDSIVITFVKPESA